jgi:hypothetical protein
VGSRRGRSFAGSGASHAATEDWLGYIGQSELKAVARLFKAGSAANVVGLLLSNVEIGGNDVVLKALLKIAPHLSQLQLFNAGLFDLREIGPILDALPAATFESLDISSNNIKDANMTRLMRTKLPRLKLVSHLYLRNTGMLDGSVLALADYLRERENLEGLYLGFIHDISK